FDTPTTRTVRRSIKLHVPEFSMVPVRWKFNWFKCTLTDAAINPPDQCKDLNQRSANLENQSKILSGEQKAAFVEASLSLTNCARQKILLQRSSFVDQTQTAIDTLKAQIKSIRDVGGNPEAVKDQTGNVINLVKEIQEIEAARDRSLDGMDKSIKDLD